jgi:hypothetical protein
MGYWGIKHYLTCKNCKKYFLDKGGERTSDIKRGKLKLPFCCRLCANTYYCKKRENVKCKRCRKTRRELSRFPTAYATGVTFNGGYCPACYRLRLTYNKDEKLIRAHELTQQLKKESADVKRNPKHKRPSEDASGVNRRSKEGKGGSSPSAGDKRSFFADIAISPVRL